MTAGNAVLENLAGQIWVITDKGAAVYQPGVDRDAPAAAIRADQNSKEVFSSGKFTIIFAGRDKWNLTPPEALQYSYRLERDSWSPLSGATLVTFNLPVGKHIFKLIAVDHQGNANAKPARFEFLVVAPWYRTSGFRALASLVLAIMGYLLWLAANQYRKRGQLMKVAERLRKTAEDASRSKSEFLANMSHEIRTPMNGILGMTELALEAAVDAEQRDYLRTVKESADALMSILNDILDFSKIEAGKLELSPIEFDLQDCVGDCMRLLAMRASEKGIELTVDIRPGVPSYLIGDPGRVRQILMNLVGNSIKFTEKGGVMVRVSLDPPVAERNTLHFLVADTGIGVPLDKQEKIFGAFEQADGSTTRRYGGTGLGLAISRQLVALMGGKVWIESPWDSPWRAEGGLGSAFHFTAEFETSVRHVPVLDPSLLEGLSVLIVDDNRTNRFILSEMLSKWGLKPHCVESGNAALAALDGEAFPLIILDNQMPDMDGFTTAAIIRKNPRLSATRIVMLSSSGTRGDGARCIQVGIQSYLFKPAKSAELFSAICTVMATQSAELPRTPLVTRHSLREAHKSLRILVAEDNAVNQKLVVRMLERLGHKVTLAHNGRQAVDIFDSGIFDIVLMDVQMPELDGMEATGEIREHERRTGARTPIYALTAHAMKGDRERCLAVGMDGYLTKPIQSQELCKLLDSVGLGENLIPAVETQLAS